MPIATKKGALLFCLSYDLNQMTYLIIGIIIGLLISKPLGYLCRKLTGYDEKRKQRKIDAVRALINDK